MTKQNKRAVQSNRLSSIGSKAIAPAIALLFCSGMTMILLGDWQSGYIKRPELLSKILLLHAFLLYLTLIARWQTLKQHSWMRVSIIGVSMGLLCGCVSILVSNAWESIMSAGTEMDLSFNLLLDGLTLMFALSVGLGLWVIGLLSFLATKSLVSLSGKGS